MRYSIRSVPFALGEVRLASHPRIIVNLLAKIFLQPPKDVDVKKGRAVHPQGPQLRCMRAKQANQRKPSRSTCRLPTATEEID